MLAKVLPFASLLATSLALPDVTMKALPTNCASYPKYNSDTNTAGPWSVMAANSDKPALDGFGGGTAYSVNSGGNEPSLRWGALTVNHASDIARNPLQCISDKLHILANTKIDSALKLDDAQWTPVLLSEHPRDATLMFLSKGADVQPTLYEHYIGSEKQDGFFLGGYNTSTWGMSWTVREETVPFAPYFYLRLLPEGQALYNNETKTFIKIQA